MRRKYFHTTLIVLLAAGCCLTACKKDEATGGKQLSLVVGDFCPESGQKLYMGERNNLPVWNAGDSILLSQGEKAAAKAFVHQAAEENKFEVTVDDDAENFKAVYPVDGSTLTAGGGSATIPALQEYRTDNYGNQLLATPMAACLNSSGGSIYFRNLASVICVEVQNYSLHEDFLTVYTVSATAKNQSLSGTMNFTFGSTSTSATKDVATCTLNETGRGNTVTLFCGIEGVQIPKGGKKRFYLVVAPYTEADSLVFTINGASDYTYSSFTLRQNTARTLPRNTMGTQVFASSFDNGIPCGVFTVNAKGDKVEFAPGNLQYLGKDSLWRFAPQQYAMVGYDNVHNTGNAYKQNNIERRKNPDWIDMFFWGTTGCGKGHEPYATGGGTTPYTEPKNMKNLTISGTDYDWGHFCRIYNPRSGNYNPKGTWRLPRGKQEDNEYHYILNERETDTRGLEKNGKKYEHALGAHVKIGTVYGLLIFPDKYVHPSGLETPEKTVVKGDDSKAVAGPAECTVYTTSEWKLMELAGCAFLPACGFGAIVDLNVRGCYFTADCYDNSYTNPYYLDFAAVWSSWSNGTASFKSVRLVRDVRR